MLRRERMGRPEIEVTLLPDYGKKKLLGYADTFRDLARTFTYVPETGAKEPINNMDDKKEENGQTVIDKQNVLCQRRLFENREILADHLKEMAHIMTHVAEESFHLIKISEKKQKQIIQILKSHGIAVQTIYMIEHPSGHAEVSLQMKAIRNKHFETEEVAGLLSVILNRRFVPNKNSLAFLRDETDIYIFEEETTFAIFTGVAKAVKESEAMSGDNYTLTDLGSGKFVCAISDGMGSGEKACEDSGMVVDLLEKLLEAGFERHTAIQMINGALIACDEEQNMSTLDMCEINLRTGNCTFLKVGASISFLKRKNIVEIIKGDSLPLGIFHQMELNEKQVQIKDGDYIIMISDGIEEAFHDENAPYILQEFIERIEFENPREIANQILQFVIRACGGKIRDDMTVIAAGVWNNEESNIRES